MTAMNNEDPADPSVHEPRVLDAADDPLPQPRVPNHVLECIYAYGDARADDDGNIGRRLGTAIAELRNWCADQMREAIAAERERHAQAMRDAARYRFVRTADKVAISAEAARDPVAYDAAIDAAIAAEKEQPK